MLPGAQARRLRPRCPSTLHGAGDSEGAVPLRSMRQGLPRARPEPHARASNLSASALEGSARRFVTVAFRGRWPDNRRTPTEARRTHAQHAGSASPQRVFKVPELMQAASPCMPA
eukprot:6179476-Pleurochrysis_carterae.AAC.1